MRRRSVVFAAASLAAASAARAAAGAPLWSTRFSAAALAQGRRLFETLAHDAAALPPAERIVFANLAINRCVEYAADSTLGATDVWLTPAELLALGRGDCEDIAIAKYFVLLAGGSPADGLRLMYAWRRDAAGCVSAHVVALAADPFIDPFVLDNLTALVMPLSEREDLEPVFSFDLVHLREGAIGRVCGSSITRLSSWRHLLVRWAIQRDGQRDAIVSFARRAH